MEAAEEEGGREGDVRKGRERGSTVCCPAYTRGFSVESEFQFLSYLFDAVFMLSMMILMPPRPSTICSLS